MTADVRLRDSLIYVYIDSRCMDAYTNDCTAEVASKGRRVTRWQVLDTRFARCPTEDRQPKREPIVIAAPGDRKSAMGSAELVNGRFGNAKS